MEGNYILCLLGKSHSHNLPVSTSTSHVKEVLRNPILFVQRPGHGFLLFCGSVLPPRKFWNLLGLGQLQTGLQLESRLDSREEASTKLHLKPTTSKQRSELGACTTVEVDVAVCGYGREGPELVFGQTNNVACNGGQQTTSNRSPRLFFSLVCTCTGRQVLLYL